MVLAAEVVGWTKMTIVSFIVLSTYFMISALEGGSTPARTSSMLPMT
jgi:hypothetical protein